MRSVSPPIPAPGRPRDERLAGAVIDATLAIVGEDGIGGLTTDAVAARARVSKASIYRRWPSKQALLRAAAGSVVSELALPDTGALRTDVHELVLAAIRLYRDGLPGRLFPALVSEMAFDPELAGAIREGFLAERRNAVLVVLGRARERGELRADLDDELVLDLLAGVIYYRFLITGGALDDELAERLTSALLFGIATSTKDDA
jgi:AcrR family transcriptional regulator